MEPESGARRHVEKATADELQARGKAGIFPIEYFGKEARVMLSSPEAEIEYDSPELPASIARRNPEQADALVSCVSTAVCLLWAHLQAVSMLGAHGRVSLEGQKRSSSSCVCS
jgi:hypothetical protein